MSEQPEDDREESRGKRGRSPNYPSVSLEQASKWARQIYDAEKRTPTTSLILAQRCGFNGLSGPARSAISALKKYGLIVDADGDRMRVSDDALKLFLQPDEGEKLRMLQSLATKPQIVKDIFAAYPDGLPSMETVRYHLITQLNFTEDGATTFLKLLNENIAFAKLDPKSRTGVL